MKNILILCGGQSPEHEISIRSTKNILQAINREKYQVILVGISKLGNWFWVENEKLDEVITTGEEVSLVFGTKQFLKTSNQTLPQIDVVFPVLHGTNGEDGSIQGLFEMLGVPYISPDVLGSSVSMDKDIAKRVLRDAGVEVADWVLIRNGEKITSYSEVASKLGNVLFVKPANMGSSVGVHKVKNEQEWLPAIQDALQFDKKVLVEKHVIGRELECAVMGNDQPIASGVGEVLGEDFYSYDEKYSEASSTDTMIPAKVTEEEKQALRKVALATYQSLGCEVLSRVDMFLTKDGTIYVNEVNTIPGFTSVSMYPKLWEEEGISYAKLLDCLVEYAESRM